MFRAQTCLNPVGAVSPPCVLRRQYSKRRVVVCPSHISTLRTSNTPWFCGHSRHTPFTNLWSDGSGVPIPQVDVEVPGAGAFSHTLAEILITMNGTCPRARWAVVQ